MSELIDQEHHTETGNNEAPTLWDRWKPSQGVYAKPEAARFEEMMHGLPRGDMPQVAKVSVQYALERSGMLLSPRQLNEPLERLSTTGDELERARVVNNFLEYCDLADEIYLKIEEASDLASRYTFDQIRKDLPELTRGSDELAAIQIVKDMHDSIDPAFGRIGNLTKSHGTAILRIMYGWEKGLQLPDPKPHLEPVS